MDVLTIETDAGEVSAELVRLGVPPTMPVKVTVEIAWAAALPNASIAEAGGAFAWLHDEPDLYTDADLLAASI